MPGKGTTQPASIAAVSSLRPGAVARADDARGFFAGEFATEQRFAQKEENAVGFGSHLGMGV